jgi:branched-chain amino acid transport system ATP-binding protein
MALLSHHHKLMSMLSAARHRYRDEAIALLDQVGMASQEDRPCAVLAYGDLKRVELAVALANDPKVLLMDEPTAGMAPAERIELMALTASIVADRGISVLFTEHDMDVVFRHASRGLVLDAGRIVADGTPEAVRADPHVQAIYLGTTAQPADATDA